MPPHYTLPPPLHYASRYAIRYAIAMAAATLQRYATYYVAAAAAAPRGATLTPMSVVTREPH